MLRIEETMDMEETRKDMVVKLGVIVAAIGASLCCVLPLLVAVAGIGSAALGAQFEPIRPYFTALTLILLGFAFYRVYKPDGRDCEPGQSCALPAGRRRQRILVWIVAVVALLLLAFPYYVGLLL